MLTFYRPMLRSFHTMGPVFNSRVAANIHMPDAKSVDSLMSGSKNSSSSSSSAEQAVEKNEVVKKYILNGSFTPTNTIFTYSAVMEDLNYFKHSSSNNAQETEVGNYHESMLYFLKLPHRVLFTMSTGQLGFKKKARGEYESGHQLTKKVFEKILADKALHSASIPVEVVLKNFGKGRKAFLSCLAGKEGEFFKKYVTRISDDTNIKFGGTKSRKARRV